MENYREVIVFMDKSLREALYVDANIRDTDYIKR